MKQLGLSFGLKCSMAQIWQQGRRHGVSDQLPFWEGLLTTAKLLRGLFPLCGFVSIRELGIMGSCRSLGNPGLRFFELTSTLQKGLVPYTLKSD